MLNQKAHKVKGSKSNNSICFCFPDHSPGQEYQVEGVIHPDGVQPPRPRLPLELQSRHRPLL